MTRPTLKKLHQGPLKGAVTIAESLRGKGADDPPRPTGGSDLGIPPVTPEVPEEATGTARKAKIRYNQGLGWNEDTQTWWMHRRVGKKTFTRDTEESQYDDAVNWMNNFVQARKNAGKAGKSRRITVAQGVEIWSREAPRNTQGPKQPSPGRVASVQRAFRKWVTPLIGNQIVEELETEDLESVIQHYTDTPGPEGPHTEKGLRNFKCDLNTVLRFLRKRRYIKILCDLPFVPQPKVQNPVIVPFQMFWELLDRFDQLVGYDIFAMTYIRVMAFSGTRTDNTRSLQKEQFNKDLTSFNTGPTKNGEEYDLPIPEEIRAFLRKIPDIRKPGPLLPNIKGGKRSKGWCLGALKDAATDVGMTEKVAWHRLRATYATMLVRSGADVFVLMEALGWKTVQIALHYIHTSKKDVAKAQESAMRLINEHRVKPQGVAAAHGEAMRKFGQHHSPSNK